MPELYVPYLIGGGITLLVSVIVFLLIQNRAQRARVALQHELNLAAQQMQQCDSQIDQLRHQLSSLQERAAQDANQAALVPDLRQSLSQAQQTVQSLQSQLSQRTAEYEATSARFEEAQRTHKEKVELLEQAEQRLQTQFENLANKIFEQKSSTFSKANKEGLDAILSPLKDQIEGFKKQVTDQYVKEGQERASLKTEILGLKALNQQITEEAAALTRALKGDNKQQGNWGEVVLERILKESGLREGHEFETQFSSTSEEKGRQLPDVVVHLPNDKDIIIDSKVSLSAYERYFNSDDDAERQRLLQEHINSIRQHIKGLGKKDYHNISSLRTLDYVLMFIPVEPAFLLAVDAEPELVKLALDNNIMLVSPTNLLVALRTINNIWQYEYQNQNAQHIAQQAAKLYDKFANFVTDLEKVGRALDTTNKHYGAAFNKLTSGRGNLLRQVESFRELGVQPSKRLPTSYDALDDKTVETSDGEE